MTQSTTISDPLLDPLTQLSTLYLTHSLNLWPNPHSVWPIPWSSDVILTLLFDPFHATQAHTDAVHALVDPVLAVADTFVAQSLCWKNGMFYRWVSACSTHKERRGWRGIEFVVHLNLTSLSTWHSVRRKRHWIRGAFEFDFIVYLTLSQA